MEEHGYPLRLTTEASIDLADDPELLELMYRANFRSVFIGIETPREESLNETKKFQNVRGDSLEAKLARIRNAGLESTPGSSSASTATTRRSSKTSSGSSRKTASPGDGRHAAGDSQDAALRAAEERGPAAEEDPNCNFVPKQMTPEGLRGYWDLVKRLYTPEAYLDRYFKVYHSAEYIERRAEIVARPARARSLRL